MVLQVAPELRGEFPAVIDSTMIAAFHDCFTKGYWEFMRNLRGGGVSIDLIAGGAFARGLEVTRKLFFGSGRPWIEALEEGMAAALTEYTEELGVSGIPEGKEKKGPDRVIQAMDYYFEQWPAQTDHIQPYMDSTGQPMAEYTFSIPLPYRHPVSGDPLVYAGRFDLVGLYNKQIVGTDEKTTSQLGPTWSSKWNLRGQFAGYVWAMRQFNLPAVGMIVRGISFLSKGFGHAESLQMRTEWQVETWRNQMFHTVERMLLAWHEGWFDQVFAEACSQYGGCPFQQLCNSPNPESWVSKYQVKKWNPLARVPYEQPQREVETIHDPLIAGLIGR